MLKPDHSDDSAEICSQDMAIRSGIPRRYLDVELSLRRGISIWRITLGMRISKRRCKLDDFIESLFGDGDGVGGTVALTGGPSTGKTRLAAAVAVEALARRKTVPGRSVDASIRMTRSRALFSVKMTRLQLIKQAVGDAGSAVFKKLRSYDLLVIDGFDIWADQMPDWVRTTMADVLVSRHEHGLSTLLISRNWPDMKNERLLDGSWADGLQIFHLQKKLKEKK